MIISATMKENNIAHIGLGTNLGKREENLQKALSEIAGFATIVQQSSIYESEPVGYKEQGDFLNMALEIATDLNPLELMRKLQEVEQKMGKKVIRKDGPRVIDLDILLYDNEVVESDNVKIPHPEIENRNFVLTPLAEIAAQKMHPELNKTIGELLKNLTNPDKVWIWKK